MRKPHKGHWPRITLVTAVYNGENYLEETIRSVVSQGYPNLEYIIVDDGSTDGTVEIIKKYEQHLTWWVSQENKGLYASLNTGFARSSGEIMGWLNANDMLQPGGLAVASSVLRDLPDVEWITGRPTHMNEEGITTGVAPVPRWSRYRFLAGANRTIQQESTFWRRTLWEKAGGYLDASGRFGHVSDFELWVRFFRHAQIYPVDALMGGFRMHGDSIGLQDIEACYRIHDEIVEAELQHVPWGKQLRWFRRLGAAARRTRFIRYFWQNSVEACLYHWPGPDWPPVIRYNDKLASWVMHKR